MHNLTHKLKHYLDGSRQLEDTFKYSTVLYAVAFIHLIITIVFLHYNIFPMYLYNILIFGVYLYMAGVYIKKKAYRAIYLFSISEILFHSVYATLLVGWEWGFVIYDRACFRFFLYGIYTITVSQENSDALYFRYYHTTVFHRDKADLCQTSALLPGFCTIRCSRHLLLFQFFCVLCHADPLFLLFCSGDQTYTASSGTGKRNA